MHCSFEMIVNGNWNCLILCTWKLEKVGAWSDGLDLSSLHYSSVVLFSIKLASQMNCAINLNIQFIGEPQLMVNASKRLNSKNSFGSYAIIWQIETGYL